MVRQILNTKLNPPPLQTNLVRRTRLIDRLWQGLARTLTLISAPAGFGKTTLVTELMVQLADRNGNGDGTVAAACAWLSLDEADNDPTLFLTYLAAALQRVDESLGETMIPLLQSPQPVAPSLFLGTLINELTELPHGVVLVMDDYHLIENTEVHDAITYLLNHQPPQLHLVITTRADPPLPLARLRVRQQMLEIRAEDLRFTSDEAAAFMQQVWGIDILPEHVAALEARTEGWIAGLQLAALSMERLHTHQEIADFIEAFTGSHRYVLDYLADEVLQQQPPEVQDFLLRSAILDRLCAEQCDEVLETATSQAMLEKLEAANLFIVPLDDRREWYRYHHLFVDLLRHRLKQTQPNAALKLHARAGAWYKTHNDTGEAIAHALKAENPAWAAQLIEQARWQIHGRGELGTLRRWLHLLPSELVDSTGALAMLRVWLLLYAGKMQDAEAYLKQVVPVLDKAAQTQPDVEQGWRGEMAVLQAQIALNQGDSEQAIAHCARARNQIAAENLVLRSILESMSGKANQMRGNLETAQQAYAAAAELGVKSGNQIAGLAGLCNQAALCELQGRLRQALALQQEALALAKDRQGRPIPLAGVPYVGLGKVYREWNQLDTAIEQLEKAIRLGRQAGVDGIVVDGTITLALVHMAQGLNAHTTLEQAQAIVHQWQEPYTELRLAAFAARFWLAQGNEEPAIAWANNFVAEYGNKHAGAAGDFFEIEYTTLARVLLAQGRPDEAQALLNRLLPAAESSGRSGRVIEILSLLAVADQALGNSEQASKTITRALRLAQPEGYIRVFADEGRPMGELLARVAMGESTVADYAAHLLATIPTPSSVSSPRSKSLSMPTASPDFAPPAAAPGIPSDLAQWLAEPLSERELEVLQLVAKGCSNREIGDRLYISVATVKKHMENIHGKLYVNNRTQAVARARELGIL